MMTRIALHRLLAGLALLATPLALAAEESSEGFITIAAGTPVETAEAPAAPAAPATVPMIPLPQSIFPPENEIGPAADAEIAASGEGSAATASPEPMIRDSASAAPGATAEAESSDPASGWRIQPRPSAGLPIGYQVGASLPEPGLLRITGEFAETTLSLALPPGGLSGAPLQLAIRSSVNLAPEQSVMQVQINETAPVEVPLVHLGDFVAVDLPSSGLVGGQNLIKLSLTQPHRIFCGPDATFGVWTEILLAQSGIALGKEPLPLDPESFALAVLSQTAGGQNLTLLASPDEDPGVLRRLSDQLRRNLGHGGRIEQRSFYEIGQAPMASVALIAADTPLATLRRNAAGGIVLQVQHHKGTLPDLTPVLADLDAQAKANDPLQLAQLPPGQPTSLAALGSKTIIGKTRYFRHDLPFILPNDWLLMANQKARLDLDYGFSKGLAPGSILLIKANETTIRLLPLDVNGGEILPTLPISFNANLLHPGRNQLSFEMIVPGDPPTEVCPAQRADLLAILGDSTLTVPPSPSMILPGLTPALLRLDPLAVVAAPEVADATALNIIAQDIASELAPAPSANESASIIVARVSDLAFVPLDAVDLSQGLVQQVLFPPAVLAPTMDGQTGDANAQGFQLSEDEASEEEAAPPPAYWRIWQSLSSTDWISQQYRKIRDSAFIDSTLSLREWLNGRQGIAFLMRPYPEQHNQLWLILGPSADPQRVGLALQRLGEGGLAQGEAALLTADESWQIWAPVRPPHLLVAPEASELRTVLGNYASWSPLIFTLVMLGLALLSCIPALLYIVLNRREDQIQ